MSRFDLSDIQSSTLICATDSLDEMLGVAQTLIQTNGLDALVGLTLSVQIADSEEFVEAENEAITLLLQSRKAYGSGASPK